MNTPERLRELADDVGVTAWAHATRVDGPEGTVSLAADEAVPVASLYKLPLAVAWADLAESGAVDAGEVLAVRAARRAAGFTGISMLLDDLTITQRDAVRLMLAVSDNASSEEVLVKVGRDRLQTWLDGVGLRQTVVRHGSAESLRIVQRETGAPDPFMAEDALADVEHDVSTSEYDPALASSSTAEELCVVLRLLWSRQGPPHAMVRDALAHQVWRHRIGSGFPHDDVVVHAKSGTLGRLRHEAAVVCFPREYPVAVTVLTRSARPERHQPRVDAVIGELARVAVAPLRMQVDEVA